ncbi:sigma-70 family RNA polymerase sigma factor [Massilia sp.]|uniref:sigma-70 family RNA polymerase sigma factor n=1 Tax=Massilia sp. TaxID=1882437 RepID=UPI00352D10CD
MRQQFLSTEFRHSYGWLAASMHRLAGCRNDAKDLASSAFVELAQIEAFERIRQPRTLLTTIARRLTFEFWRRRDLERHYLDALARQPKYHAASPEELCLAVEELVRIDAALRRLRAKAGEAFLLSQYKGLGYAEIAVRLGVSASMVRKYIVRAPDACWPAA